MIFSSLDLAPDLQKAIDACGYREMTAIQEQAIIPARRGKDILATAQTGTGKTAAFSLPILQKLAEKSQSSEATGPQALILTPTRELAEQLAETIGAYAQFLPITVKAVYGGAKIVTQETALKAGVDVLIATPGRLLEHIEKCNVELSSVQYAVLDEADRMLDMGFISDVQAILKLTAKKRQTLLFSATLTPGVNELSHKLLKNHLTIRANKVNATAETVQHVLYPVEERRKIDLFMELLEEYNWFQVLVFTSTKEQADQLRLKLKKHPVAVCHGDKSQGSRRRAIADFKSGKVQILIATEVAARGLDIQGLEYVINFNLPYLAEDYVHRIGRAGRAGQQGHAISFVSREEERSLDSIQRLIGQKIKRIHRDGFEVNYRDELVKKIASHKRPMRKNKASQTTIKKRK
ncbi:DEAD/DEAH box helicase [Leucothrix pacifica]|uniref:RNA helicase n=1 Tax=Leucothrix pacifica TaxID=1247513 RepID=A0A317C405_9GAMM|nr:DEAD/DEAH box helicase [Leucothrix pacifica]PWQ92103.1 RNA helicase [Leucothrix pacifica]